MTEEGQTMLGPALMVWPINAQYKDLVLPDTWSSLESFVTWYMENSKPILPPYNAGTFCTDDATAICVFRHGQYQVEFYIIHPGKTIPVHSHPGMEVITVLAGGSVTGPAGQYGTGIHSGRTSLKLTDGLYHGGRDSGYSDGFLLYSFEKWDDHITPTSAALQWKGATAGPVHDALLMLHFPDRGPISGFFDISNTN